MRHLHPDALMLIALGEPSTDEQREHLQDCSECSSEIIAFRSTATRLGRELKDTAQDSPPPQVWQSISAALRLPEESAESSDSATQSTVPAGVASAERRSTPRWSVLVAAVLVGLLIGGAGTGWLLSRDNDSPQPAAQAQAQLGPVGADDGRFGDAVLLADGPARSLKVQTTNLPPTTGSYEVWLLGPDGKMFSLGFLQAGQGSFTIPSAVALSEFATVDISNEPDDGNPTHSGDSIARGILR